MREIKFRAWNPIKDRMAHSDAYEGLHLFFKYVSAVDLQDNFQLMQYTGLKDKNGKEIYEGDILQFDYYYDYGQCGEHKTFTRQVDWNDTFCGFSPIYGTGTYIMPRERYEVIGNIHENKELLK